MTGTYTPWGLKNKMFNQAHLQHHLGQNRPHQKTITHPQGPPPELPQPYAILLHGSEGLVRPPLPSLYAENVPVVELLLYDR